MDEDNSLIEAVALHRSLFDPSHPKYKDVELRTSIWQQIASDLTLDGKLTAIRLCYVY